MKYAADFRQSALNALSGKWLIAVLTGFIATLLGGLGSDGPEWKVYLNDNTVNLGLEYAGNTILYTKNGLNADTEIVWLGIGIVVAVVAIVFTVLFFILRNVIEVGYARFNLELVDGKEEKIEYLFQYFRRWKTVSIAGFLQGLYVFLWSLLFVIPGIVASYSYAMTSFILAEHPEMSASEAIAKSKEMMSGNRFRLFCLQFSFIGWAILCIFTLGIGYLWLRPYEQAATAAFYREISAR